MLCEKCKNKGIDCQMTAKAQGFAMGFSGKKPMHKVGALWFPGRTPKDLEDWCAKNCKPAKPVELVKEVKEVIAPEIKKAKREEINELGVKSSYYKPTIKNKDEKKD